MLLMTENTASPCTMPREAAAASDSHPAFLAQASAVADTCPQGSSALVALLSVIFASCMIRLGG